MKPITSAVARVAVAAARASHESDLAALELGRGQLAAAKAALDHLAADDEAAVARHARRLEARARSGESGPPPALVPTEKHVAAQITAQRTHAATRAMLSNLEAAARSSAAALAEAEATLKSAADAEHIERLERLARKVIADESALEAQRELLRAGLDAVPGVKPPLNAHRALHDGLNLPVTELGPTGSWDKDWNTPIDARGVLPVDAREYWTARYQQSLTGEDADPTVADVAA